MADLVYIAIGVLSIGISAFRLFQGNGTFALIWLAVGAITLSIGFLTKKGESPKETLMGLFKRKK